MTLSEKIAEAQQWSAEDFFPRVKRDKENIGYSKFTKGSFINGHILMGREGVQDFVTTF